MFQADFWKKFIFWPFWPKTVQKWPFWPKIPFFGGFWLITLNFDISFGWKLPKTFSLVPSSVFEYPNPCKNSESGIFLAFIAQKLVLFSPFLEFWLITSVFDISFGWKLSKIFSLVSSSVFEYPNPCENSESGIFLALIAQKLALFSPWKWKGKLSILISMNDKKGCKPRGVHQGGINSVQTFSWDRVTACFYLTWWWRSWRIQQTWWLLIMQRSLSC